MTSEPPPRNTASILVVAISSYRDPQLNRPQVEDAARRVIKLFSSPNHVEVEPPLIGEAAAAEVMTRLVAWGGDQTRPANTGLLLWTGHAEEDADHQPLLHTSDMPVTPEEVAQALKRLERSGTRKWVVILDCCFGHSIGGPIYQRLDQMTGRLPGSRFVVISSVDALDEADAGVFTAAVAEVLEQGPEEGLWSVSDDYIEWDAFVKRLREALDDPPMPRAGGHDVPGRIIPNPRYRPRGMVGGSLDEEYFLPKARGIEAGESGWFFTGRLDVLGSLVEWLDQSGSGVRVVTGSAGTGKSAVLGRLITLSVPSYRNLAPPEILADVPVPEVGGIQLAFHARERRVEDLLGFLADGLGSSECRDVSDLYGPLGRASSAREDRPFVVVVDALDEALGDHGRRMFNEVLQGVSSQPGVKVLIGSRPGVIDWHEAGVSSDSVVDLDRTANTHDDIGRYAARRLRLIDGSPYADLPPEDRRLQQIAIAVANASVSATPDGTEIGSFLIARVITKTLAAQDPVDPSMPGWQQSLPTGLDTAFENDLAAYGAQHGNKTERLIKDLLEGLAWDEGQGIPRRHIPLFAEAATGRLYDDDDITALLRLAGGHITETEEDGWALYRLYHERFREHLRNTTCRRIAPEG